MHEAHYETISIRYNTSRTSVFDNAFHQCKYIPVNIHAECDEAFRCFDELVSIFPHCIQFQTSISHELFPNVLKDTATYSGWTTPVGRGIFRPGVYFTPGCWWAFFPWVLSPSLWLSALSSTETMAHCQSTARTGSAILLSQVRGMTW